MFSLKDIIDIAVQIERNGERVYRSAAEKIENPSLRSLLQRLADDEIQHAKWFEELIDKVPGTGEFPEQEKMGRALLQDAVGAQSFTLEDADFSSMKKIEDLLSLAIEFEKDTALFYGNAPAFDRRPKDPGTIACHHSRRRGPRTTFKGDAARILS